MEAWLPLKKVGIVGGASLCFCIRVHLCKFLVLRLVVGVGCAALRMESKMASVSCDIRAISDANCSSRAWSSSSVIVVVFVFAAVFASIVAVVMVGEAGRRAERKVERGGDVALSSSFEKVELSISDESNNRLGTNQNLSAHGGGNKNGCSRVVESLGPKK